MEKFVLGYVMYFEEGEPESQVLHIGTREECQELFEKIPAVSSSGSRKVVECEMKIVALPDHPKLS